jgi:hypothetical protein
VEVAATFGISESSPVLLHTGSNLIVHFPAADVIAKVTDLTSAARSGETWLKKEIAICSFLREQQLQVLSPATILPPGPHWFENSWVTFWNRVETVRETASGSEAGMALKACHKALEAFKVDVGEWHPYSRGKNASGGSNQGKPD